MRRALRLAESSRMDASQSLVGAVIVKKAGVLEKVSIRLLENLTQR